MDQRSGGIEAGDPDVLDSIGHFPRRELTTTPGDMRHLVTPRGKFPAEREPDFFHCSAHEGRHREKGALNDRDLHDGAEWPLHEEVPPGANLSATGGAQTMGPCW